VDATAAAAGSSLSRAELLVLGRRLAQRPPVR
jgi:hypothetical protein